MTEQRYMVLTAVGHDRPGLVQEISSAIHRAGANLEDSRMAILGGEFALILLFTGPSEAVDRVRSASADLEQRLGLTTLLQETQRPSFAGQYLPYRIRVSGVDRPGIVSNISRVFVGRGINVASLESRIHYAPLSGTPMFVLQADLQVPSQVALSEFRRDLLRVCEEENLDYVLEGPA